MAYRRFRYIGVDKVKMDFAFFAIAFNPNRSLENDKKLFLMTAIRKTALYMLDS